MKKRIPLLVLLMICLTVGLYAQTGGTVRPIGEPNPEDIGVDTAQQKLREVSVTRFEDAGFWYTVMSRDFGTATVRRFEGSPMEKEPLSGEKEAGIVEEDKYVLGVKIQYYKRAMESIEIYPIRPIAIEGICKTISVWVVGRNNNHVLKLIISDFFGNTVELNMGKLNFTGWKKMTVAIPPTVRQRDFHYNNRMGSKVEGFRIDCEAMEAFGNFYIYFDDMRAVTDLFAEENRDEDDMQDIW